VPVLCLGEAIVDLICERPVRTPAEADAFVPRFGGATANVAVAAARHGAEVALAGGAGQDSWGEWLIGRLQADGVDTRWFGLLPGLRTPLAFVTVAPDGEPRFDIYGDGIEATIRAVGERLEEALADASALFFGSNTLVGAAERELTLRARELALERGLPVVFDPNLRLARWAEQGDAVSAARACLPGSFLVKLNREEARLLTGAPDPETAARDILAAGARLVAVTLGAEGAILRGEISADAPGVPARVVSTVGAGDALAGVLLARLALAGFYPPAAAAALPEAVAYAARVTERWGAVA
jgi:sugar/nucleoside kinase (ribokinase family)